MKRKDTATDIIEIKDPRINVSKIVEEIKRKIDKKKIEYLRDLGQNLPSVIDVVENSEYLLDGWFGSDVIGGQRARWTEQEFSFLINPGNSGQISLEVVSTPPDVVDRSVGVEFFIDKKLIDKKSIVSLGGQIVSFSLPDELKNKNVIGKIRLSHTFCPAQLTKGGDMRELGLAISRISNSKLTDIGSKYLPELVGYESTVLMQTERVRLHANPESFLPKGTKIKFIKLLILRSIRVFTAVQTSFNYYVADLFKNINAQNKTFEKYLIDVDTKVASLKEELNKIERYEPVFWTEHENDFYNFHQKSLRGDQSKIKELLKVYLPYFNKSDFYKNKHFIDFGSGRGEFLELLKEKGIESIGVDINSNFVDLSINKKLKAVNSDAIGYLKTLNDGCLGGASAFHLVEHFTFPQLFDFLFLIKNKLVDGGLLLLETPNPDNVVVAAEHFYNDFSHKTKLPPILLLKLCEYIGFKNIKIVPLHPERKGKLTEIEDRLYGSTDYALVANK